MTEPITYTLLDPTGNMTLLAETSVPEKTQPLIARKLMELEPETEQVGFISYGNDEIRLRMAGGEFCGNASMSAAVLYMLHTGSESGTVPVHVSGTPDPVIVEVETLPKNMWRGRVIMPRPLSVKREHFPDGMVRPVVQFPGITHVILEEEMEKTEAEKLAPIWCQLLKAEGLGLMFLNREKATLKPLVYVPEAGTLFWESSCASGTTAVGAVLLTESAKPVSVSLRQPGGTLEISAEEGKLLLTGTVKIIRRTSEAVK